MIAERGRDNDTFQGLGDQQPMGGAVLCMRNFLGGSCGGCRFGGAVMPANELKPCPFCGVSGHGNV